jgi:2-polyprenyl-3-methyl-5-hydroxy-6-metoxy-1,4-benzoquinol methylase
MRSELQWVENTDSIICQSIQGLIFRDTREHWSEALCRLMNLTVEEARTWVEIVGAESVSSFGGPVFAHSPETRLEVLTRASRRFFRPAPNVELEALPSVGKLDVLGTPIDSLWIHGIRENRQMAVIGNRAIQHGILVRIDDDVCSPACPPEYEELYFEGEQPGLGYGKCHAQSTWRMEKAARLARQIHGVGQYVGKDLSVGARLLDVGSGYGYFRVAASERGWFSDGVEISRHAASVARDEFGLGTFVGTLEEFNGQHPKPYDVITLFDIIEHVVDPVALLQMVNGLLAPGGLCIIRTPNLIALEADIFTSYYHSLKAEHLHYFSPASLCFAMEAASLEPVFLASESHLLRGFFESHLSHFARLLKGSDLFAAARKLPA